MLPGELSNPICAEASGTVAMPATVQRPARNKHIFGNSEPLETEVLCAAGREDLMLHGFDLCVKRAIDVTVAACVLVCIAPAMIVIWLIVRLTSEGSAIYTQERIGCRGKPFKFYKFRTMYIDSDDARHRDYIKKWMNNQAYGTGSKGVTFKIVDDSRVTPVGRMLRRYSLDELPQIFNVLKLEMSLVGPRPALPYEIENYSEWHKKRLQGIPGLTGAWQVAGRNGLSFDEMVRLDIHYLRTWSLLQDLKIIAKTIPVVFSGNGN